MTEFYLNERIMQHRVAEAQRQAELRRLQKETRKGRPNWLVRQRNRLFSWLGCSLVSSGQNLLQSVSQSARSTEGRADRAA